MDTHDNAEGLARKRERKISALRHKEEEERTQELAARLDLPYEDLVIRNLEPEALLVLSDDQASTAHALVIRKEVKFLTLATTNPNAPAFAALRKLLHDRGYRTDTVIVSQTSFVHGFSALKRFSTAKQKITGEVRLTQERITDIEAGIHQIHDIAAMLAHIKEADASEFVEVFLAGALKLDASDIHIEPAEQEAYIRYRLDGVLHAVSALSLRSYQLILSRLKLLAGLKLNVKTTGQDGRFTIIREGQEVEIRASSLPGEYGEYVVMRVLNPKELLSLEDLGIRKDAVAMVEYELRKTHGMILATGPTGSGKSTALYAFLKHVVTPELKIITIEDPIEYRLQGVEQTQIDPDRGYTFANALRSIVRQDPDIILVGEIRDHETADIALHAGLTGHLVFATLHTNEAVGAFPRLIDFGLDPEIIASALNLVIAQRLVRRLCKRCAQTYSPSLNEERSMRNVLQSVSPDIVRPLWQNPLVLLKPGKCADCYFTGFRGRIGLFEFFVLDDAMKTVLLKNPPMLEMQKEAMRRGMITVQQDGVLKILRRITSLDEVERVTGPIASLEVQD